LRHRLEAENGETKEETMRQEEKSADDPEKLNNSGIKKYFKLKESNFISKLIGELKKKYKKYEKLEDELITRKSLLINTQ